MHLASRKNKNSGERCSVCLSNSKQLFHNQTVLISYHYFGFDAVTHSIKDVSVSTINRLLLPNCSGFMGKSRINRCQEHETEFRSGTSAKRIYLERLLSGYRAPLTRANLRPKEAPREKTRPPPVSRGSRVNPSIGLLATASASALALFLNPYIYVDIWVSVYIDIDIKIYS